VAELMISTTDDKGRNALWRLVPTVARDGFLLVPTLEKGSDAALFLKGQTRSWVRSFRFEAPAGQAKYWSHVNVGAFAIPSIPLRPADGPP
jgi:hypothetical protein